MGLLTQAHRLNDLRPSHALPPEEVNAWTAHILQQRPQPKHVPS